MFEANSQGGLFRKARIQLHSNARYSSMPILAQRALSSAYRIYFIFFSLQSNSSLLLQYFNCLLAEFRIYRYSLLDSMRKAFQLTILYIFCSCLSYQMLWLDAISQADISLPSASYAFFGLASLAFLILGYGFCQTNSFLSFLTIGLQYYKSYPQTRIIQMLKPIHLITLLCLLAFAEAASAPFIPFNELHPTGSEFELNLILNENRNIPILMLQYSEDKTLRILKKIIQNALDEEKDISFAMLVDCRKFNYDLNNSLGVCRGFSEYQKQQHPSDGQDEDSQKITDAFLKLNLFSPNPTRIVQKGHALSKNHDIQDLRQLGVKINYQFLAKVIRNQIPEYVKYIEDNHDLQEFLKIHSEFRLSKGPKLLYFDQNLQSPLFIKKLAINLDGWVQVGVSDSSKIAQSYGCKFDDIILLEYNFETKSYTHEKIPIDLDNAPLRDILQAEVIKSYTNIRKPRDILLDFEHKSPILYNLTNLKQLNQLLSHGRIIIVEVSKAEADYQCDNLNQFIKKQSVIFNFVCFAKAHLDKFLTAIQFTAKQHWSQSFFMIDGSFKQTKVISNKLRNVYEYLPKGNARQQISSQSQGELCIKAATAAQKQPIFYYFNEKTHSNSLNLLKYFSGLSEINSILYFCQFYMPNKDVISTYQLSQNTVFTLAGQDNQNQLQKVEHKRLIDFLSIKMFIREVAITKMLKVYDEKIIKNELIQIKNAQELTKYCFSNPCIIGLIETGTFHQESQLKMLKQMQIAYSEQGYKFYWIDGVCHFEVGKQLKLTQKGAKNIDRSYLMLYKQKGNEYALWKASKLNKFWDKKSAFRWVKSLRNPSSIGRIKFGIDLEDKPCIRQQVKEEKAAGTKKGKQQPIKESAKKKAQVNEDEL